MKEIETKGDPEEDGRICPEIGRAWDDNDNTWLVYLGPLY
jgi:hypothetical protein